MAQLPEERDAARHVKRKGTILVVLGITYNAFAGSKPPGGTGAGGGVQTESEPPVASSGWGIKNSTLTISTSVSSVWPSGASLESAGWREVVSFISNHSWISEPSFVVLRQHLLDSFDKFWGEIAREPEDFGVRPGWRTSETVLPTRFLRGIQQGVATSLWVKAGKPQDGRKVLVQANGC